jgi:hypothetical protein
MTKQIVAFRNFANAVLRCFAVSCEFRLRNTNVKRTMNLSYLFYDTFNTTLNIIYISQNFYRNGTVSTGECRDMQASITKHAS